MNYLSEFITPTFLRRVITFLIVGLAGTAAYAIIGYSMIALGADVMVAHIAASVLSLIFSYLAQKIVTFKVRGMHRRIGPRYAIATAILLVLQVIIVGILNALDVQDTFNLLAIILFVPPASFLIHNFWTFKVPLSARPDTNDSLSEGTES